jgi:UDP-N-acetylglucosamine 2-epimerase (non-hydrolysing)
MPRSSKKDAIIDIVVGARPNFIKALPLLKEFEKRRGQYSGMSYRLIHTGQHYDKLLSDVFFSQLKIPAPDIFLNAGSGTSGEQTAAVIVGYEKLLSSGKSDLCVVFGDVNSTISCALTARKCGVKVAHVEAGLRSGDWSMPEEINRVATDALSNYLFTTSDTASSNLLKSGFSNDSIFFVGNIMLDTLSMNLNKLVKPPFFNSLELKKEQYFVLTLHRPANVDVPEELERILLNVCRSVEDHKVIFPVHPRTRRALDRVRTMAKIEKQIILVDPQPYLEFNYLVSNAMAVLTDSGGVSEETTFLGVPCITLRTSTERPETVTLGTNRLVGNDLVALRNAVDDVINNRWRRGFVPPLWDGNTSSRIYAVIEKLIEPRC